MNTEKFRQELGKLRSDQELLMKRLEKLERAVGELEPEEKEMRPKPVSTVEVPTPPTNPKKSIDLEFRIGGTWLNRIGVAAVILGLAYFLKYSFDNQWIGPTGRVLLGILTGLFMMGAGEKLRYRYAGYAQGLLGGGSLALYFSIFSSYQFYHLFSIRRCVSLFSSGYCSHGIHGCSAAFTAYWDLRNYRGLSDSFFNRQRRSFLMDLV